MQRGARVSAEGKGERSRRPGWSGPEPLISHVVSPTLDSAGRAEPTACDREGGAGTPGHARFILTWAAAKKHFVLIG